MYCIGAADRQPASDPIPPRPPETPAGANDPVATIRISPVETLLRPGDSVQLTLQAFNARGQKLKAAVSPGWSVAGPAQLQNGRLVANRDAGHAPVIVTAKLGEISTTARARIVPPLPWKFDFADGVPATWIGMAYRHQPKEIGGEKVLVKVATIPKGTRSQGWMGGTDLHDYTIQADVQAAASATLPDMGIINQRYTLDLMGVQQLQLRSWTSRLELRFAKTVPFAWEAGKWYTIKLRADNANGQVMLKGKVWLRGTPEPSTWTIEAADATPNVTGSPGLFGNSTSGEFYIDNVLVTPNRA
jgi:hypothetical protein